MTEWMNVEVEKVMMMRAVGGLAAAEDLGTLPQLTALLIAFADVLCAAYFSEAADDAEASCASSLSCAPLYSSFSRHAIP